MKVLEHIEKAGANLIALGAATMIAIGGWFTRVVLTNQKQLSELRAEINAREITREVERVSLEEIRTDLREIKKDVKVLYSRSSSNG